MGKIIDSETGERLLTGAELLKGYPPKNILFSNNYSDISATTWTSIVPGNALVIKSDLPLVVRINRQEPIRDVYCMQLLARPQTLEIQRQNSGTFPDTQVVVYSIWPGQVLRSLYRDPWDLPSGSTAVVTTIAISTTSTITANIDLSSVASENTFLYGLRIADTAGTGTQVITEVEIIDQQGSPQTLWRRGGLTSNTQVFTFLDLPRIKLPNIFRIRYTHSSDAVNTNELTAWPVYAFR